MTSPVGIPLPPQQHPMDKRALNIVFYVIGAICTALALVEVTSIKPWVKALTAFGTMMFAVARWDKVLPTRSSSGLDPSEEKTPRLPNP